MFGSFGLSRSGLGQRLDGARRIALDLREPRNADDGARSVRRASSRARPAIHAARRDRFLLRRVVRARSVSGESRLLAWPPV